MGMVKKVMDLKLIIDGLILDDDCSVDDFIESLGIESGYPIVWEILYEEYVSEKDVEE